MEPDSSLTRSQEPAAGSSSKSHESSPHSHTLTITILIKTSPLEYVTHRISYDDTYGHASP
jgi:hydroxyacyl-ACP dehydratase HTD2-like protein with hotdog domain